MLIATYLYPPGGDGAEKQAEMLANLLARDGWPVTVLTSRLIGEPAREVRAGVEICRLPRYPRLPIVRGAVSGVATLAAAWSFVLANCHRFDVVLCTPGGAFSSWVIPICRLARLPVVLRMANGGSWHEIIQMRATGVTNFGPLFAWFLTQADRYVVLNQETVRLLAQDVDASKIRYIPNGVAPTDERWAVEALEGVRVELGLPPRETFVLAVGRLVRVKGFDVLIRAAGSLGPTIVIAGEGPERSALQDLACETGTRLQLLGQIDRAALRGWMRAASVVAVPSRAEGMSNALLETMALGCPVVVSHIPGNTDLVRDDQNGLVVPMDDSAGLRIAIDRIVAQPALAARLGANARADVRDRLSLEKTCDQYKKVFAELVAAGS